MITSSTFSLFFPKIQYLSLAIFLAMIAADRGHAQNCFPISHLPCENVCVELPYSLSFGNSIPNTISDSGNLGTGFTMVQNYSGTRHVNDSEPADANLPGYLASKLALTAGTLQITTNKGLNFQTSNNLINALGVEVRTDEKIQISAQVINPYNGALDEQAGIWFGLNDKTFLKLAISKNRVELRREIDDISSTSTATTNPDQRRTGTINGLNTKTVYLRLVIDPVSNTATGMYSTDGGTSYSNAGAGYPSQEISIAGTGLTGSKAHAGLFASHRNGTTPVTYTFDNFEVRKSVQFKYPAYTMTLPETWTPGTSTGTLSATSAEGGSIVYSIKSGNTNGTFSIHPTTGVLSLIKKLNHHTQSIYNLTMQAVAGQAIGTVPMKITVISSPAADFPTVNWSKVANQPYKVSEAQGEVVNEMLYTFGGFDSQKTGFTPTKRSYVYKPGPNTWTAIADLPFTPNGSNFGGITHAGITNDGTDIYIAGGYTSNAAGTGQAFGTQQVWKYNVAANNYTRLPDLPIKIAAGQMEYLNGRLHHIAGTNAARTHDLGDHYVLDLGNLAAGWKTLSPLPNPRQHAGSAVYEGHIYYIGGQRGHDAHLVTLKDVHRYDVQTDTWTKMTDLPAPETYGRGHISSATVVMGNRIIVIGGEVRQHIQCALVSAYSPATNTWTELTPIPEARFSGVSAVLNGNLFYTGGSKTNTTFKGVPANPAARLAAESHGTIFPDQFLSKKITIFPNPARGRNVFMKLENFEKNEKVKISVLDSEGKLVLAKSFDTDEKGSTSADMNGHLPLSKNTYIIRADAPSGFCMGRLVVD
ncbi:Kelch repeat-containing protein [Dyadobacter bucti]|uniref:Kelch repeat-containing protein n=1 Tax=Dyadobacter bucti TaxID=2572203 RepID=UPI00110840FC|nr:kelch repeat-containing protein [Dyadobacter bucti]